ncbi:hypothetical protein ACJMK2_008624 [Sinanodonta woodiana]|uniref:Uncharacterized protein n=1 Tax=Sinanodonta woodiana TaxID=1069815 RepID=A0ABD3VM57_SINWO
MSKPVLLCLAVHVLMLQMYSISGQDGFGGGGIGFHHQGCHCDYWCKPWEIVNGRCPWCKWCKKWWCCPKFKYG